MVARFKSRIFEKTGIYECVFYYLNITRGLPVTVIIIIIQLSNTKYTEVPEECTHRF